MNSNLFGTKSYAVICPLGKYRYSLTRILDDENPLPLALFIMLNPSTADATNDDPTIKRCMGFARDWNCGALEVVNLFAYRATNPDDLNVPDDPIGPDNDNYIQEALRRADITVCAWGVLGGFKSRDMEVLKIIPNPVCLGTTKDNYPRHPLYVARGTELVTYYGRHGNQ